MSVRYKMLWFFFDSKRKGQKGKEKTKKNLAIPPGTGYTKEEWWDKVGRNTYDVVKSGGEVRPVDSITGTYERNLDAKDRLMLPAKLQGELGDVCYLTMGIDKCLALYPEESWKVFTDRFAALPVTQSRRMRPLFANAVKCKPDSQGRIQIPQRLQQYAGITRDVAIIGVHSRAELWDAETWRQNDEEMTPEKMAALMEEMDY